MSLYIDNSATDKQIDLLVQYGYVGSLKLNKQQASEELDRLLADQPLDHHEPDRYDFDGYYKEGTEI